MYNTKRSNIPGLVVFLFVGLVAFVGLVVFNMNFAFAALDENDVGIVTINGEPTETLGSGTHFKWGWRARIYTIDQAVRRVELHDPATLTKDQFIIGLTSTFDLAWTQTPEFYLDNWERYGKMWRDISNVDQRVRDMGLQSYRACIGDSAFKDAVVGKSRNDVADCINSSINDRLIPFGLEALNLVIPDITVDEKYQSKLDEAVQIALDARKAEAEADKIKANAEAEIARQEGEIRIANAKKQEEARQLALLAQLEADRLQAEQVVITQTASNNILASNLELEVISATKAVEIFGVEQDLIISRLQTNVAKLKAEAANANLKMIADIYEENPDYARQLAAEVLAVALGENNKMIVIGEGQGVDLQMLLGENFRPVFDVNKGNSTTE